MRGVKDADLHEGAELTPEASASMQAKEPGGGLGARRLRRQAWNASPAFPATSRPHRIRRGSGSRLGQRPLT